MFPPATVRSFLKRGASKVAFPSDGDEACRVACQIAAGIPSQHLRCQCHGSYAKKVEKNVTECFLSIYIIAEGIGPKEHSGRQVVRGVYAPRNRTILDGIARKSFLFVWIYTTLEV